VTIVQKQPGVSVENASLDGPQPILRAEDLRVRIGKGDNAVRALRGVTLELPPNAITGLVGESGCGKTMTGLSILRLLPKEGRITGGQISFGGRDLAALNEKEMRGIRGARISMIFQNAPQALNPLFTVGDQIARVYQLHEKASRQEAWEKAIEMFYQLHEKASRQEAWEKAIEMLDHMGVPDAALMAREYPHRYSGGMAQRAMIAMALVCSPELLIGDEPTTGLDVTIEAQVLDLIVRVVCESKASMLLISHDMGVIARTCQYVAVMYAGEIVEYGPVGEVFENPQHPYTRGLLSCVDLGEDNRMRYVPGIVPDLRQSLDHCAFAPRCTISNDLCWAQIPKLYWIDGSHAVGCHTVESSG
jgi:peptide/nickel transport system ATP-binding protein